MFVVVTSFCNEILLDNVFAGGVCRCVLCLCGLLSGVFPLMGCCGGVVGCLFRVSVSMCFASLLLCLPV